VRDHLVEELQTVSGRKVLLSESPVCEVVQVVLRQVAARK
jgi:hypothetical protein